MKKLLRLFLLSVGMTLFAVAGGNAAECDEDQTIEAEEMGEILASETLLSAFKDVQEPETEMTRCVVTPNLLSFRYTFDFRDRLGNARLVLAVTSKPDLSNMVPRITLGTSLRLALRIQYLDWWRENGEEVIGKLLPKIDAGVFTAGLG